MHGFSPYSNVGDVTNTGSIEKDKFGSENSKLFANLIRLEFHLFGSTSAATYDAFRDMRHVNIKSIHKKKKKKKTVWDTGEREFRKYSQITGCKMKSVDS